MGDDVSMAGVDDHIEFIDVVDDAGATTAETVATPQRSLLRFWPMLVVAVASVWILGSSGDVEQTQPFDDSPSPTVAPISPMTDTDQVMGGGADRVDAGAPTPATWPPVAENGDPPVTVRRGDLSEPLSPLDRTIVYVSAAGTPTVVSLATGDVFDVYVAAIRVHDRFAVRDGEVAALIDDDPEFAVSTDGAVVFHTYRDVDRPGVGTTGDVRGIGRGPELCLSENSCSQPGQGLERRIVGGVQVERFDPDRHADVDQILQTWESVDDSLVAPDGFRIPAPGQFVWVITPLSQT